MWHLILCSIISLSFADNSAIQEFTNANNLFTQSVYKETAKIKTGNFLVSPFSAETVLAFLQSGSNGKTGEEIRTVLNLPNDKDKIESALKSLLPKFKSNYLYTLHTANKLYVKDGFTIKNKFKETASLVYQSDAETVDFEKNVEAANTINSWVEKQTNNKIKNLIESEDLDEYTRAVLVNALYFKANWSVPFLLSSTYQQPFYKTSKNSVKVDMLHHFEEDFKYYECPHLNAQFLELPFKGGEAEMVIVLPNEKEGLSRIENQLEQVFLPQHHFENISLNVALPKFRVETSIDFKKILQNLGVKTVFEEKKADLSGIAGNHGDIYVKKVAQKTFIDVNEEGVEAAAATFVIIPVPSMLLFPEPKNFIADHPFIFYIKIKDVIIFAGRVTDPSV